MSDEEIPPEYIPLPSMLTLYRRDMAHFPIDNLDLPIKIAMTICNATPKLRSYLMDFIQQGNEALLACTEMHAQNKTREEFRRYVSTTIKHAMYSYLHSIPMIHIPPTVKKYMIAKEPDTREIIALLQQHVSWESWHVEAEPTNMQRAFSEAKQKQIHSLLSPLSTKERQVLLLLYGIDGPAYEVHEVAALLGVTKNYVYGLEQMAIKRITGKHTGTVREQTRADQQQRMQEIYERYQQQGMHCSIRLLMKETPCAIMTAMRWLQEKRAREFSPHSRS